MSQQVLSLGPKYPTEPWYKGLRPYSIIKGAMVSLALGQEGDMVRLMKDTLTGLSGQGWEAL